MNDTNQHTGSDNAHAEPAVHPTDNDSDVHPLTPQLQQLTEAFERGLKDSKKTGTPIHVDEIASRIAKFYEMVRKVVDWKEDNVLRRSAIERSLKRTLFGKLSGVSINPHIDTYRVAFSITADLIRGGHLPNDEISQENVLIVETALKKYLYILEHAQFPSSEIIPLKQKFNFTTFVIELASCEIEEILVNPVKEQVLLETMTDILSDRIHIIPEGSMTHDEKKTHVYIATCRTLFDLDDHFILYELIKYTYPEWSNPSPDLLARFAIEIPKLWIESPNVLEHHISRQLHTIAERVDSIFMLIGDVMDKYKDSPHKLARVLSDKTQLTAAITESYNRRFLSLKSRLMKLAIFSTLSVFLSNWVTFFIVEVPLASIFYEGFSFITAVVDFAIPTLVMLALVSIIRPPPAKNLDRVLRASYQFLYDDEKKKLYDVYVNKRKNKLFTVIMTTLYLITMMAVLWGVGFVFYIAKLPITSVIFDTLTIAITFFAAVLIRNKSKELSVDDQMSLSEFLLDMVSVPIARIGSILANKWKEYNVIAILFTFLIETPMVVIFDFIENWSQYIKERRSELH